MGRAFVEAYRQAAAGQRHAQQMGGSGSNSASNLLSSGLTIEEACKILNVPPPKAGKPDLEQVMERFKKLFDLNRPENGGSFYLQSKILRARERIESEVREADREAKYQKELADGWNPKIYKDR